MQFGGEGLSLGRLEQAVDAAREGGLTAVSANDHLVFSTPWLDGPTALASVIERTGDMTLATTVSLAVLRGPVPLAKMLTALDMLSEGRLIAALGPGSSQRDYDALGIPFDERWKRFDEAITTLRALLEGKPRPEASAPTTACRPISNSRRLLDKGAAYRFGSGAGARTPDCAGSRALETAGLPPRTTRRPARFAEARDRLAGELARPRPRCGGFSQRSRHDVDLGRQRSRRGRSSPWRRPRAALEPRSRRASRPALHRPG